MSATLTDAQKLYVAIERYLLGLRATINDCEEHLDGQKCIFCREREHIIYMLEAILREAE